MTPLRSVSGINVLFRATASHESFFSNRIAQEPPRYFVGDLSEPTTCTLTGNDAL